MSPSPKTPSQYWALINEHWDAIRHILDLYLPTLGKKWIDGTLLEKPLGEYIDELRAQRNPRLIRTFSAAHWNCPEDNMGEWAHTGWDLFTNLIRQEEYCLYEEREDSDD